MSNSRESGTHEREWALAGFKLSDVEAVLLRSQLCIAACSLRCYVNSSTCQNNTCCHADMGVKTRQCCEGGVLVHCVAGVSRSATVCLGYLMSHEQLRYPEAWRILQRAR